MKKDKEYKEYSNVIIPQETFNDVLHQVDELLKTEEELQDGEDLINFTESFRGKTYGEVVRKLLITALFLDSKGLGSLLEPLKNIATKKLLQEIKNKINKGDKLTQGEISFITTSIIQSLKG